MVKNDASQVAVKYYQQIPHILQVGSKEYAFTVRARICMAWVEEAQVGTVLAKVKVCCGGNKKAVYRLANEDDVRRWMNGGGR